LPVDAVAVAQTEDGGSDEELGECLRQASVDDVKTVDGSLAPGPRVGEVYPGRAAAALLERPQSFVHLPRHSQHHFVVVMRGGVLQAPEQSGDVTHVKLHCAT